MPDDHRLDEVDLLEPIAFEEWVLDAFRGLGFRVSRTPRTGDAGADGLVRRRDDGSVAFVIQCKHVQRMQKLGKAAIDQVLRACSRYRGAAHATPVVVTNAPGFTSSAEAVARAHGVLLVGRDTMLSMDVVLSDAGLIE